MRLLIHVFVYVFLAAALAAGPAIPARAAVSSEEGAPAAKPNPTNPKPAKPSTKRHPARRWHGYGFLPGYVPPEAEPPRRDYWTHPPVWWYGGPGFYRGRWNGGGFGPCWTQTPIGPMWNCGR